MQTGGMTPYNKGDVVLVLFPFTNQAGGKPRPAIVLSVAEYNQTCPDVVIASVKSNPQPVHHLGDQAITDWQGAGLAYASIAQVKIVTVESAIILRKIGELQPSDMSRLEAGLRQALGL